MLRIRAQVGYQHDPQLERMRKKIRQTPRLAMGETGLGSRRLIPVPPQPLEWLRPRARGGPGSSQDFGIWTRSEHDEIMV